ncbi:unnamed protein product [Rotaria magnacalcarata]|uniref:G protein-coupled receptor n=1 Tax=Rotaria magnacalcarata TaxID=392030 RepID=A0A8S3CMV2_9BILA|nr:unnamed protein product [Rotaria magnacalcarata]
MTAFTFAHAVYDCITAIYGFRQDWAREQPLCAFTGYVLVISAAGTHHAHLVEALSRLFFTVFFKRKFLQTYRVHWCLIIEESRLCYPTTKQFTTSMYLIVVGYVTPLSLTLVIYFIIWHTARMSLRRTMNRDENNGTRLMPHAKREMKLARNLLIAQGLFSYGGTPYLILVIWQKVAPQAPPPESLYLIAADFISLSITLLIIVHLVMNKEMKDALINYLKKYQQRIYPKIGTIPT